MNDVEFRQVIDADPMQIAKDKHGPFVKSNPNFGLGFDSALQEARRKRRLIKAAGDSYSHMEIDEFINILLALGFVQVLKDTFERRDCESRKPTGAMEEFQVWYDRDRNVIATMDTYRGKFVNHCNYYYNWKQRDPKAEVFPRNYSGFTVDPKGEPVLVGYNSGLDQIVYNLRLMDREGEWLKPWRKFYLGGIRLASYYHEQETFAKDPSDRYSSFDCTSRWDRIPADIKAAINWDPSYNVC